MGYNFNKIARFNHDLNPCESMTTRYIIYYLSVKGDLDAAVKAELEAQNALEACIPAGVSIESDEQWDDPLDYWDTIPMSEAERNRFYDAWLDVEHAAYMVNRAAVDYRKTMCEIRAYIEWVKGGKSHV